MIVDTFLFNNEFDMLDIHLEISKNYVDKWIVLEADRTLSGIKKEFHLQKNIQKYKEKYGDRFEVVSIELEPNHPHASYYETGMRKGFKNSLDKLGADDIVIHGDLDEILNPTLWNKILQTVLQQDKPVSCAFEMFFYKFDQQADRNWKGSVVAKKKMFDTPHDLYKGRTEIVKRKYRDHCVSIDELAGWHWSWIHSDEIIKDKVDSLIEHRGRNPIDVLTAFKNVDTKTAINHKCNSQLVKTTYPAIVLDVIKKYPSYWHNLTL